MRVFISSPSGLEAERAIVIDEISSVSSAQTKLGRLPITITRWPDDIAAGRAEYGQSVINQQTMDYDIFVGLIGVRMGTPTPRANSGTEEEFDRIIEALLNGHRGEVLLFFSNMPTRLAEIDPNQLFLVKAFKEKAARLGVLYHTFNDHTQLRGLFRTSFQQACHSLTQGRQISLLGLDRTTQQHPSLTIDLGAYNLKNRETAPQRADSRLVQIAPYRGNTIVLSGNFGTASPYFRFGFKYYDSREQLFGPGSIQTLGQNMLVHVGRNSDHHNWFVTIYRGGYRLGSDQPIDGSADWTMVTFAFEISSKNNITLRLNDRVAHQSYFVVDGIPCLALLGWSDEHEFACNFDKVTLQVNPRIAEAQ